MSTIVWILSGTQRSLRQWLPPQLGADGSNGGLSQVRCLQAIGALEGDVGSQLLPLSLLSFFGFSAVIFKALLRHTLHAMMCCLAPK